MKRARCRRRKSWVEQLEGRIIGQHWWWVWTGGKSSGNPQVSLFLGGIESQEILWWAEYQRVLSVDKRFDVLVLDRQFSKRRSYQSFDLCASAFQPSPKRKDWFFIGSLGVRNWSGVKPIGRHMYEWSPVDIPFLGKPSDTWRKWGRQWIKTKAITALKFQHH